MARVFVTVFNQVLVLQSCLLFVLASKLNVPRVLLPVFEEFNTNFTLEVVDSSTGECYKWTTTRPDIIQLLPSPTSLKQLDCLSKVTVSTITKEWTRNTAIVFAEDTNSGHVLRCDIIVDVISSLEIITTTRELFREEAPEAFEVRANDDQGNEFTTLEGVEFQWSIIPWAPSSDDVENVVLRFIPFANSRYETPSTVMALEKLGRQGHIVLVEGLKTGSAKVSVKLPYKRYCGLLSIEVQLMVVANMIIIPSDVYILPGDTVKFHIFQIKQGKLEEIMTSHQYFLKIEDESVAELDGTANDVKGLKIGKTKVTLHDRNVNEMEGIKIPSATLTVTEPAYITLDILPSHNWAVMIGQFYEIVVEIFDKENHKLNIGDYVEVSTSIPEEYFEVQFKSNNGTYFFGSPVEVGTAQVRSTLLSVTDSRGNVHQVKSKISAQTNMMIYKGVKVYPSEVFLPWDPVKKPRYEVTLQASGGDGDFKWTSMNESVATVSETGIVKTLNEGHVEIIATMASNHHSFGVSTFDILVPNKLQIIDYVLEIEIGSTVFLHIAMFAERNSEITETEKTEIIPFTHCSDIPFKVQIFDPVFSFNSSLNTEPVGFACATLGVTATDLGTTKITVSYTAENLLLEDSVRIASFQPLTSLNPADGVVVLAVGSSRTIMFSGGPRPWFGRSSQHVRSLEPGPGESEVIEVSVIDSVKFDQPDVYAYRVLCKQLGEAEVILTVTNKPMTGHCRRSKSMSTVTVHCAKPRELSLVPDIKLSEKQRCPINFQHERMVVQNHKDIEVLVIVKDDNGRVFDNITTLDISWRISDETLGDVANPGELIFEHLEENGLVFPLRQYQIIQPKSKIGIMEITADILGYKNELLQELDIVPEFPAFPSTDRSGYESTPTLGSTLSLLCVDDTVVIPDQTYVFNHPKNSARVQISQGSGYYELILSTEEVADIKYVEGSRAIDIVPKIDGVLKLAVIDLCMPSKPALGVVHVVSVGSIKVDVAELVEKGRCTPAVVYLFDNTDNVLPISDLSLLNLRPILDDGIISVKLSTDKDAVTRAAAKGQVPYVVTGLQLGEKNLAFASGNEGVEVFSPSYPIQVFPPLRLFPRNITLIVGSVFQVSSRGGPQPVAHVEYSTSSSSVANINSIGLVEGFGLGKTAVTGKAVGTDKSTGKRVIYSQDSVEVYVIPLMGIKIRAPLVRIIVGATMPVSAHGIPEELSTLIIGSARPYLLFDWAVSSPDVIHLHNPFHIYGISIMDADKVSMLIEAHKAGRSTIYLNVTAPARISNLRSEQTVKFEASLDIEVFEELRLIEPQGVGERHSPFVLMAPNAALQLKTNHEGNLLYSVLGSFEPGTASETSGVETISKAVTDIIPLVTVTQDGLVNSRNLTGRTVIIISVKEEFGLKQVLGVTVEVKQVHYLMINFSPAFRVAEDETVSMLPKGVSIDFTVSYHDNTGIPFTVAQSDLKIRTNRFDLLEIGKKHDDGHIHVSLNYQGSTMLKVYDHSVHYSTDRVQLSVGEVILPTVRTLTLGDVICFSMPLVSPDGTVGTWSTDNEKILNLNPHLGIGRARLVGNVEVRYHLPNNIVTSVEMKILPVSKVKLFANKGQYLTNTYLGLTYRVPVVLSSEIDKTKTISMYSRNGTCPEGYFVTAFPFYCAIRFSESDTEFDIDEVFHVHQNFNLEKGEYACEFIAADDPPPRLSTLETDVVLTVESGGVLSSPLTIPFMPAIHVSTPEVRLTNAQMWGMLIVNGIPTVLEGVTVTPGSPLLTVIRDKERDVTTSLAYRIILSDEFWQLGELSLKMNVSVISEITKQNLQIPVKVHLTTMDRVHIPSPCLVSHISSWGTHFTDYLYEYRNIILLTIIAILVGTIYSYIYIAVPMAVRRGESMVFTQSTLQLSRKQSMAPTLAAAPSLYNTRSNYTMQQPFVETEPVYGDPRVAFHPDYRRPS